MEVQKVNYRRRTSGSKEDREVLRRRRASEGSGVAANWRASMVEGDIVPPTPAEEPLVMSGNLHKLGRIFKTWKQRYFEIQGCKMYYYKSSKKPCCLGYIDLTHCYTVGGTRMASFGAPFELKTANRVHVLAARNEADMNKWVEAIKSKMALYATGGGFDEGQPDIKRRRATVKRSQSRRNQAAVQPASSRPRSPQRPLPPESGSSQAGSNRPRSPQRPLPPEPGSSQASSKRPQSPQRPLPPEPGTYQSATVARTHQPKVPNQREAGLPNSHSYHGFDVNSTATRHNQYSPPASPEHITLPLPSLPSPTAEQNAPHTITANSHSPPPAQVEATPLTETVAESLPSPLNIEATSPSFKGDPDFSLPPSTIQEEEEVAALLPRSVSPVDEALPPVIPVDIDLPSSTVNTELSPSLPLDLALPPVDAELPSSPLLDDLPPMSPVDVELPPLPGEIDISSLPQPTDVVNSPPVQPDLPSLEADVSRSPSPLVIELPSPELPPLSPVDEPLLPPIIPTADAPIPVSTPIETAPADRSVSPIEMELPTLPEGIATTDNVPTSLNNNLPPPSTIESSSSPRSISPVEVDLPPVLDMSLPEVIKEEEEEEQVAEIIKQKIDQPISPLRSPPPVLDMSLPEVIKEEEEEQVAETIKQKKDQPTSPLRSPPPPPVQQARSRSTSPDTIPPKLPPPPGPVNSGRRRSLQSPPRVPPPPPNSFIGRLRELVAVDESWRQDDEEIDWMPSPGEAPWLQEDNAMDQLRHYLRVCD